LTPKLLFAAAGIFVLPVAAAAQSASLDVYCREPIAPLCVNRSATYEDAKWREECNREVARYVEGMRAHARCLNRQGERALEMAESLDERHACMAKGLEDCR